VKNPFGIKEFMRKRRIPAVGWESEYPLVLMVDSLGKMPTRHEVSQLESFLNYLLDAVPVEEYVVMRRREYDMVMTKLWRTIVFHKYGPNDWGFRFARSWWSTYWPYVRNMDRGLVAPVNLVQCMDEAVRLTEEDDMSVWEMWKKAQEAVFA
jgi:hypothetical protein